MPSDCKVTDRRGSEKPCLFPWTFYGLENIPGCANPDDDEGGDWCPTELVDGRYISASGNYGFCRSSICREYVTVPPL